MRNILLVGFGGMGNAHFNSLFKKKEVHFDIYDSKVIIKDPKKIKKIAILKNLKINHIFYILTLVTLEEGWKLKSNEIE